MKILAPKLELVPSLSSRIHVDEDALVRLTDEQKQILDMLAEARQVGVRGGCRGPCGVPRGFRF